MRTIYLLRHGEIKSDGIRRFLGQTDARLSPRGIDQARMWRDTFSETGFDGIYTSDLSRCADTARIISEGSGNDVSLLPELREIHLGKLEGLPMEEVRNRFRHEWEARGKNIANYIPEGGESFSDLQKRVVPVIQDVSNRHEGNVLIVTHAGVNRVILCHILGMPLENLFRIDQAYGCLNLIKSFGDFFRIYGINLAGLPG